MELLRDILLGIVQGITGYLPVSSTGHIALVCRAFQMDAGYSEFILCLLKISSLSAVFIILFKEIIKLVIGSFQLIQDIFSNIIIFIKKLIGKERGGYYLLNTNPYKKQVLMVVVSSAVTGVVSVFIRSVAVNVSQIPMAIGVCFVISGIVLFLAERVSRGKRGIKNMSTFDAALIGIAQGVSIMPGISRMSMAYAAALALGYTKSYAVRYSCILSIPAIIGSALISFNGLAGTAVSLSNLGNIFAAMLVCIILSVLFLKLTLNAVKKNTMTVFALYGIVFGVIVIIFDIIV